MPQNCMHQEGRGRHHLEEGAVVTLVQGCEEWCQVRHRVYDRQYLGRIDNLLLERDSVQCDQAGDDRVEDALFIGEQLCPAAASRCLQA